MNILTSLKKLASDWKPQGLGRLATGIVSALAVCSATSVLGQVTVATLGGGPGAQDVGTSAGSSIITFTDSPGGQLVPGIKLDNPLGMAFDAAGNLYIAENGQGNILKVSNPGNRATSFTFPFATGLNSPVAVAVDSSNGDVYVLTSPTGGGTIRRYTSEGVFVSVITAALVNPTSFIILSNGDFVVTEVAATVKRITPGGVVTVLNNTLVNPTGITLYSSNRVAIADGGDHSIKLLNLTDTTSLTLLAGGTGAGFTNGLALNAKFNTPRNISLAPDGSLLVADQFNHRVRIITPDGNVSTVYGVSSNNWNDNPFFATYPGWKDGTNAHANQPFGVIVGPGATNVFVTEIGHTLDLLRVTSGFNLGVSAGTNNTTTNVFVDTTLTNTFLTLGFANGEASSDYVASPGQYFQVPVTLTLPTGQFIHSLGFAIAVTNVGGSGLTAPTAISFESKLMFPGVAENGDQVYFTIPNIAFTGYVTNITVDGTGNLVTNYVSKYTNTLITNITANMLDVAWLELTNGNNIYPAEQDLISFSSAHINLFDAHRLGRVIVGSFGFQIPATAPLGSEYRVQVFNASAATGLNRAVEVITPTNASSTSLLAGNANSIKRILVQTPRTYLVGDIEGFRWYNVGEFGNGKLDMIDVQEAFMMASYHYNVPTPGSDFYNTVDSYNIGSGVDPYSGDINTVTTGDGKIDINDVITTLRRTLDYTVQWVYRFGGGLYASNGPGVIPPDFGLSSYQVAELASVPSSTTTISIKADDVIQASGTINVPIHATVNGGGRPKRMMLSVYVEPFNGAPTLAEAIGYTPGSPASIGLPNNSFIIRRGKNAISLAWLDTSGFGGVPGLPDGDNTLLTLAIKPSRPLVAGEHYRVRIMHYSASPGFVYATKTQDGLVSPVNMDSVSSMGDGISDAWRYRYFGKVLDLMALKDTDSDGDGIPNWAEYRAGTSPVDGNSAFRLTRTEPDTGAGMKIRFMTVMGKQYAVESSTGFGSGWIQVGSTINGTDGEVVVTDNSTGAASKFYRIRLVDGVTQ